MPFFSGRSEIHVFPRFFPTIGKIFSLCAFYFPIIRLSFPIDRKENESQDVITEKQREIRKADLQHQEEKRDRERLEAQKNQNFTQVYPLGWKRLAELAKGNSAAFGFYTYLAQHIDGSCGAVVADQTFLAEQFNVTTRTIRNWVKYLEKCTL